MQKAKSNRLCPYGCAKTCTFSEGAAWLTCQVFGSRFCQVASPSMISCPPRVKLRGERTALITAKINLMILLISSKLKGQDMKTAAQNSVVRGAKVAV